MRAAIEDEAELTPEQETKMLLLNLKLMYAPGQGYWIWDRENHRLLIAIDGSDKGIATHYWPTIEETIVVASNPGKHGLKWKS